MNICTAITCANITAHGIIWNFQNFFFVSTEHKPYFQITYMHAKNMLLLFFLCRMNKALVKEVADSKQINITTKDSSNQQKQQTKLKVGKPVQADRRSYFEEQTSLVVASFDSSVSSYGSFHDEEMFTRKQIEPDK